MGKKATSLEQRLSGRVGFAKDQQDKAILEFPAAQVAAMRRKARRADPVAMKALRRKIEGWIADRMNRDHALMEYGSKVVIMTIRKDAKGDREFMFRMPPDMRLLYSNKTVPLPKITSGGKVSRDYRNPVDIWLEHSRRRDFKGMVNEPGREMDGYVNLWEGWGTTPLTVEALDEDGNTVQKLDFSGTGCRLILNHVRDVLAAGDLKLYRWMLAWFADIFQNPGDKKPSALLIYGPQGAGKSILSELVFPKLLKNAFSMERNINFLKEDAGNVTVAGKLLLAAEEAIFAGDLRAAADLKTFISQRTIGLRKLYADKVIVPNTARLMATVNPQSNGGHVVAMENDDRRWTITECAAHRVRDKAYFKALMAEIENGGCEAFHAFLLNPELLQGVDITQGYESASGIAQKLLSLPTQEAFLYECMRSRSLQINMSDDMRAKWGEDNETRAGQQDLFKGYLEYCKDHKKQYVGTISQFNEAIRRIFPKIETGRYNNDGRYWKFPGISAAREAFRVWIRCEDMPNHLAKLWDDYVPPKVDPHDEMWDAPADPVEVRTVAVSTDAIMRQFDEEIPF